ncbi:hypothetical protein [Deinococcus aquaticus]|uniref:hypothetical protein n=1 Tax=Deinococcus aquaticus TaxID=328692 RepID=UPI003F48D074
MTVTDQPIPPSEPKPYVDQFATEKFLLLVPLLKERYEIHTVTAKRRAAAIDHAWDLLNKRPLPRAPRSHAYQVTETWWLKIISICDSFDPTSGQRFSDHMQAGLGVRTQIQTIDEVGQMIASSLHEFRGLLMEVRERVRVMDDRLTAVEKRLADVPHAVDRVLNETRFEHDQRGDSMGERLDVLREKMVDLREGVGFVAEEVLKLTSSSND